MHYHNLLAAAAAPAQLQMCPHVTFSKERRRWCMIQFTADPEYHDTVS